MQRIGWNVILQLPFVWGMFLHIEAALQKVCIKDHGTFFYKKAEQGDSSSPCMLM